jgi:hypothetical protein
VRQDQVLRNASLERRGERVDIVQALSGENAFVEEVLIGVRYGGRVGIDARVS